MLSAAAKRPLIYIMGVAIVIRIAYAFLAPVVDPVIGENPLHGDASGYHLLADNLSRGLGFTWDGEVPTSYRMPGYPAVLAVIYTFFGFNFLAVRLLQAVVGGFLCLPAYLIGRRLGGENIGRLSAAGLALHPVLVYMTGWLYSETIFISLLWLGIWLVIESLERVSIKHALIGGAAVGLAAYFRPEVSILPVAIFGVAVFFRWSWKRAGLILAVQSMIVLVILPWSLRNTQVQEKFVFLTTSAGFNFYAGNNPQSGGGSAWVYPLENMGELESDRVLAHQARQWILENKGEFIRLVPLKLAKFLSPVEMETRPGFVRGFPALATQVLYAAFLFFAVWGAGKKSRTHAGGVLLATIGLYVFTALAFFGGTRVALPIAPALMLFAVIGLHSFWRASRVADFPSASRLEEL